MTTRTLRVMVVDDHSMVHIGLAGMMEAFDGIELAGQASNAEEAIRKIKDIEPDVILMDLMLGGMNGIEATKQIKGIRPNIQILILTSYENSADIHKAMAVGAIGYLLKNVTATELEHAIRSASKGQLTLAPEATKALVESSQNSKTFLKDLTERELEVLGFLARGYSNTQIAEVLVVSPFTIKAHVSNILSKMNVSTRAEAAAVAVQHNLVRFNTGES
ncbi:MAG: response regulator [Phototrophicaceae bacterium]